MSQVATKLHEFTLTLAGIDDLTVEVADALFEAGCGDGTVYSEGPTHYISFHREAESLGAAIASAVNDVAKVGFSVAHVEVEPTQS